MHPIDTSKLFSNSKAEEVLQNLVSMVEEHSSHIESLKESPSLTHSHSNKNDIESVRLMMGNIEEKLNILSERIDSIKHSIEIPGAPSTSVGEGVATNRRALANTVRLLSNKVDANNFDLIASAQKAEIEKAIGGLKLNFASNISIQKVNDVMKAMDCRLDTMTDDILNKVDKSTATTISSEVSCVAKYAEFIDSTERKMKNLEDVISVQNNQINSLSTCTLELENQMNERAHLSDLSKLESRLKSLCDNLQNRTDSEKEIFLALEGKWYEIEGRVRSCEDDCKTLFAAHKMLAKHMTRRIDNTFTKSETKEMCTELAEATTTSGDGAIESFHDINARLKKLSSEVKLAGKKAELSAQFVQWFEESNG